MTTGSAPAVPRVGPAGMALAAMYALTIVGFPLITTLPVMLGRDSLSATLPYRAAMALLTLGIFFGWWLRGERILFSPAVRLTLVLWVLLIARMLYDTLVDPLPGDIFGMPVAQVLLLSLGACFIPSLVFLETPSAAALELARRGIEIVGLIAMLLILYLGLRGVFAGGILRRLATPVLNPISVGHLGVSVFIVALCGLAGSNALGRAFRWLVILTSVVVIVASASRGPILAALMVALTYSFVHRRRRRLGLARLVFRLALLGLVIAGIALAVNYLEQEGYISLIQRFSDTLEDVSALERIAMAVGAWQQFLDHPLLGSAFVELGSYTYPHNIVLEALMATGIVGGALLLANLAAGLLASMRLITTAPSAAWVGFIFLQYVVNGMVSGSLYLDTAYWAYGFGALVVARSLEHRAAQMPVPAPAAA
ncbi:MAG: O-antigen ligase family protein [Gammaproteobacteria bacterium]|nr:O-antigen ligase family protein [Gammaproteobacteria bacterium]